MDTLVALPAALSLKALNVLTRLGTSTKRATGRRERKLTGEVTNRNSHKSSPPTLCPFPFCRSCPPLPFTLLPPLTTIPRLPHFALLLLPLPDLRLTCMLWSSLVLPLSSVSSLSSVCPSFFTLDLGWLSPTSIPRSSSPSSLLVSSKSDISPPSSSPRLILMCLPLFAPPPMIDLPPLFAVCLPLLASPPPPLLSMSSLSSTSPWGGRPANSRPRWRMISDTTFRVPAPTLASTTSSTGRGRNFFSPLTLIASPPHISTMVSMSEQRKGRSRNMIENTSVQNGVRLCSHKKVA
mmetsp:Transcript_7834/g.20342  ORF Transcript_7834/g.20342 Transcript_7834/m.20342 type:complete len:294 (+) Transcript_7834:1451-2332(+)